MRKDTLSVAGAKSGKFQPISKLQHFGESNLFDNYRQQNSVYVLSLCCIEDQEDRKKKALLGEMSISWVRSHTWMESPSRGISLVIYSQIIILSENPGVKQYRENVCEY